MTTWKEDLQRIVDAIGRGKARFALGLMTPQDQMMAKSSAPFSLAVGACSVVKVHAKMAGGGRREGFIVHIGMTRDHLLELQEKIGRLLAEEKPS